MPSPEMIKCAVCAGSGYTWDERNWRDNRSEHQVCDVCNGRGRVHPRSFDVNDLTKTVETTPTHRLARDGSPSCLPAYLPPLSVPMLPGWHAWTHAGFRDKADLWRCDLCDALYETASWLATGLENAGVCPVGGHRLGMVRNEDATRTQEMPPLQVEDAIADLNSRGGVW